MADPEQIKTAPTRSRTVRSRSAAGSDPAIRPVAKKPAPVAAPSPAAILQPPAAVPAVSATQEANPMETIQNDTAAKAQAMFNGLNDRAKGAMEKGTQFVEEMTAFGKGNIEALVESGKIAAKGVEAMGQDAAAFAKKSFEDATAAARTLASTKSPTEFLKLQGDYARTYFDDMIAHSSRSTEAMLKLAGEIAQPISNRVALAADKMKIAA